MANIIVNYNPKMNGWKKLIFPLTKDREGWEKLKNGDRVDVVVLQKGLEGRWHFSSWKIEDKEFRNKSTALNFAKSYRSKK